jgi:hypothetical protein
MLVLEGSSLALDPSTAVAEVTASWGPAPQLDLVLVFTSRVRSAAAVAAALAARCPSARIIGCTSAGEHLAARRTEGSVVALGLRSPQLRWATTAIEDVPQLTVAHARHAVDRLLAALRVDRESIDPARYFCLMLIDGTSGAEEAAAAHLAEALEGIALVGGSAGDDLRFERTEVIFGGCAMTRAAVLALCECDAPFTIVKQHHFLGSSTPLAITRVDPSGRRVLEIDGFPAAVAYARALRVPREALDLQLALSHPLLIQYQHATYSRAVRVIHADESLEFYSGFEEGMVADLGRPQSLVATLAAEVAQQRRRGRADLLIAANCILRSQEIARSGATSAVEDILGGFAKRMIGLDTYGEQVDGLHVSHSFVAVALRDLGGAA